ncbi:MAG: fumarylacetoacetate hydrolase family protein [Hyphomonadaceae bacterium]|nr:fumarylacetoacetate hydrolase family protein [Hyphomonadaceae bacterium]
MTDFVVKAPPQAAVPVLGERGLFPIRRIFCVGRNYAEHVKEMGGEKGEPIFFTKPADAVVANNAAIPYALNTSNLHYEIELVLAIGKGGVGIAAADALDHIYGYAVGCDLTRRDRQAEAKQAGAPWDVAKAFDQSAPIAPITRAAQIGHPARGRIWLSVNGETKQDADIADMIWSPVEIIAHLSRSFALQPGDLIFTGTPAGVGAIGPGDAVLGGIEGLTQLAFSVRA